MIRGSVNSALQATVRLTVQGPAGQQVDIDAVIDSGFDSWLALPPALIARLGLAWRKREQALLANGTTMSLDVYEGIVIWDGQPRPVFVYAAGTTPLIGMSLLEGFELTMQVRPQGDVAIAALP
jgi:clan AA aspartic protease